MRDIQYRYCEHIDYGVGSAQLTKYRKDNRDDLFMVSFQMLDRNQRLFFPRKYFIDGGEITFINDARATRLYQEGRDNPKKKRKKPERKRETNIQDILASLR